MLNKRLKELLDFVKTTDLQEVFWQKKGLQISFTRTVAPPKAPVPVVLSATSGDTPAAAPSPLVIRSTMVGTFYRSDSPARPPFVVDGTVVTAGQPVAAIEAMKIMKDVVSPQACRIVKALVENGHPVEWGQPLFEIEPES